MFKDKVLSTLENETKKYFGKYRGIVFDNKDFEDKRGRCRIVVPDVLGEVPTDWANCCSSVIPGWFFVPNIGDPVFVEFENGDVNKPLYSSAWYTDTQGKYSAPSLAIGVPDETAVKVQDSFVAANLLPVTQPSEPYNASYPSNSVIKTNGGHVIELDNSSGNKRIKIHHSSGSFYEINNDGDLVQGVSGDKYEYVEGNNALNSKGDFHENVSGDNTLKVQGDRTKSVIGNETETITLNTVHTTTVNRTVNVGGNQISNTSGNHSISAGGNASMVAGGTSTTNISGNVTEDFFGTWTKRITGLFHLALAGGFTLLVSGLATMTFNAAVTLTTLALFSLALHSVNVTVSGESSFSFQGTVLSSFASTFTMTVASISTITFTGGLNLLSGGLITLGAIGTAKKLVNEEFINIFNTHTHNSPAGGVTGTPNSIATVGTHTTLSVSAT